MTVNGFLPPAGIVPSIGAMSKTDLPVRFCGPANGFELRPRNGQISTDQMFVRIKGCVPDILIFLFDSLIDMLTGQVNSEYDRCFRLIDDLLIASLVTKCCSSVDDGHLTWNVFSTRSLASRHPIEKGVFVSKDNCTLG